MTVNQAIDELKQYANIGYGEKPFFWMNLNTQEHIEAEEITPLPDGGGIEVR